MTSDASTSDPRSTSTLVGYTAGVFDLFHLGHLNLLTRARERCGHLVVGVTTDELAQELRAVRPVVSFTERLAIVGSMRPVDTVVPQTSPDKRLAWETLRFDVLFAGSNLRGTPDWQRTEADLAEVGVGVVYLAATHRRSGDLLERGLADLVSD